MRSEPHPRNHQPLISIVTVVLNGERLLERTIRSVIMDQDNTVEYIVIDGGSQDGTLDIIKKYEQHIDYWVSEPDSGLYDAMNKGIKVAHGRCVGLLNSGDYYEPDTISLIKKLLRAISDRHFVIAGGIHRVDELGVVLNSFHVNEVCMRKRFLAMPLHHPAMFVSSSVYADIAAYNALRTLSADYEFTLMLIERHVKIYLLPSILTNMVAVGLSESPNTLLKRLHQGFQIRRKYKGLTYCIMANTREVASFLWHFAKVSLSP